MQWSVVGGQLMIVTVEFERGNYDNVLLLQGPAAAPPD